MGWLYGSDWDTQSKMYQHLVDPKRFYRATRLGEEPVEPPIYAKLLNKCMRGKVVWSVWEIPWEIKDGRPVRIIHCDLINNSKEGGYMTWGYKDMDETSGPVQVSCPLTFLKLADNPPESLYGNEWRERVKLYHASKTKSVLKPLAIGTLIWFTKGIRLSGGYGHQHLFRVDTKEMRGNRKKKILRTGFEYGVLVNLSPSCFNMDYRTYANESEYRADMEKCMAELQEAKAKRAS